MQIDLVQFVQMQTQLQLQDQTQQQQIEAVTDADKQEKQRKLATVGSTPLSDRCCSICITPSSLFTSTYISCAKAN